MRYWQALGWRGGWGVDGVTLSGFRIWGLGEEAGKNQGERGDGGMGE